MTGALPDQKPMCFAFPIRLEALFLISWFLLCNSARQAKKYLFFFNLAVLYSGGHKIRQKQKFISNPTFCISEENKILFLSYFMSSTVQHCQIKKNKIFFACLAELQSKNIQSLLFFPPSNPPAIFSNLQ